MKAPFPALIVFAAGTLAAPAQIRAEVRPDSSPLKEIVSAELKRNQAPGCAVAVALNDVIIFAQGFGLANVDTGEAVRAEMLFRLGSTTKMFTAATLVSLVEEGKVRLDAPAGDYVRDLAPKLARATLHQLLTHTAGLSDSTVMEGPHDESALGQAVRALKDSLAFTEPGRVYSYSNPGYWLAGLVAQEAGGKPYADLVADRVLKPCGMVRSTFRPTEAMTWPLAVGHEVAKDGKPRVIRPLADNAGGWPAGQLFSSAPEFARFCIAFMNGGELEGRRVIPRIVVDKLSTPHVAVPGGETHYGYGLNVSDEAGLRWLSHGGNRTGYGSFAKMCPERKFAVVILANKSGAILSRVAEKAAELVLGVSAAPRKPSPNRQLAPDEAARYTGVYGNDRSKIRIVARDGRLVAPFGALERIEGDRFRLPGGEGGSATVFVFVPGPDGRIEFLMRSGRALKKQ